MNKQFKSIFFHPDFTVGPGIQPDLLNMGILVLSSRALPPVGNYGDNVHIIRSPYPEDAFAIQFFYIILYSIAVVQAFS